MNTIGPALRIIQLGCRLVFLRRDVALKGICAELARLKCHFEEASAGRRLAQVSGSDALRALNDLARRTRRRN
jgi:hypothetical protein